ncbi:MAG: hypothetical protein MZV64_10775 [Ignavibacteriales bacterium]|nr:hypothetical protein [Ignavibacteriales bacterium]
MGTYFNTQLRLLTSRSLWPSGWPRSSTSAARPEFRPADRRAPPRPRRRIKGVASFRWLFGRGKDKARPAPRLLARRRPPPATPSPSRGGLSIAPIPETRLVYVSYVSPHAALAADVVNALVEEFVSFSVETRYEATKQTSEFLTEQVALLREDLKRKEEDLQKYGQEKNLLYLSDNESTVVNKFADGRPRP